MLAGKPSAPKIQADAGLVSREAERVSVRQRIENVHTSFVLTNALLAGKGSAFGVQPGAVLSAVQRA